jgi:hypothetical protein
LDTQRRVKRMSNNMMARTIVLGALILGAMNCGELRAQTYEDSLSLAGAILDRVEGTTIRALGWSVECTELRPCTPEQILATWREPPSPSATAPLAWPECPWEGDPTPANTGFLFRSHLEMLGSLEAKISVRRDCADNPRESERRSFGSGQELFFEKRDGKWHFVRGGVGWIT